MSVSSNLKETPADLEVKRKAWVWNKRELLKFVDEYAKEFVEGSISKPNREQNAIARDADSAGFPVTLVRKLGKLTYRINAADDGEDEKKTEWKSAYNVALREYANGLGLGQVYS